MLAGSSTTSFGSRLRLSHQIFHGLSEVTPSLPAPFLIACAFFPPKKLKFNGNLEKAIKKGAGRVQVHMYTCLKIHWRFHQIHPWLRSELLLASREDAAIYELHVRDFSMSDPKVSQPFRGTAPGSHGAISQQWGPPWHDSQVDTRWTVFTSGGSTILICHTILVVFQT